MERKKQLSYDLNDVNFISELAESVQYQIDATLEYIRSELNSQPSLEELKGIPKTVSGTFNASTKETPKYIGNYYAYLFIQVFVNKLSNFYQDREFIPQLNTPGTLERVEEEMLRITLEKLGIDKFYLHNFNDFIKAVIFRSPKAIQALKDFEIIY